MLQDRAQRKTINSSLRIGLCFLVILFAKSTLASASVGCEGTALPREIGAELRTSYSDWKIVSLEMLSPYEQTIWKDGNARSCPGIAIGRFTGSTEEVAVNLVSHADGKLYEQVLLFSKGSPMSHARVILPRTEVASISVIMTMAPGHYRSSDNQKRIRIRQDSISIAALEKGAIQYYWNGKEFDSIITSE